jgi:hypothetical protein
MKLVRSIRKRKILSLYFHPLSYNDTNTMLDFCTKEL